MSKPGSILPGAIAMVALAPEQGPTFIRRAQSGARSHDDALQAMRVVAQNGRATFQQRGSGGVDQATDSIVAAPGARWLKLVRQGNVLKAYDSRDGQNWEWLGTEMLPMPGKVHAGLAVTSHDASKLCTATFSQVRLTQPAATTVAPPAAGNGDGLKATYFERTDLTGPKVKRVDPTVNFDWSAQPPAEGMARTRFSVRWQGQLEAQFTEPYAIQVISDDRARLWLDGALLIDEWYEHAQQASTAVVNLEAGKRYALRLDYFQNRGAAVAKLLWSSPSTPQQIIPQSQLYSASAGDEQKDYETVNQPQSNPKIPKPWLDQDVGQTGRGGGAECVADLWTVQGSGADIWANGDGFHFVYQSWRGDGQIVARVAGQQDTDLWAKAGVMMRESLRADARHLMLAVTPQHGLAFLHRDEALGATASETAGAGAAPAWLKLVRRGNDFACFTSADGVNWQWLATETLALPDEMLVGLAVNSHDNSTLGTATFDQVAVEAPGAQAPLKRVRGTGDGLPAVYFDAATGQTASRQDPTINFDWAENDPPAPGIGHDYFSARWEGFVQAQSDGLHALHVISDDGARLWVDGQLLIDAWTAQGAVQNSAKLNLQAGATHTIKLEYFQATREAIIKLLWSTPTLGKQSIPQSQLYSRAPVAGAALAQAEPARVPPSIQATTVRAPAGAPAATAQAQVKKTQEPRATAKVTGFATVAEVPGERTVRRVGRWAVERGALYAVDRRGTLEYELAAPSANVYRLQIDGATRNPFDLDPGFYLKVSIDGEYLGRALLNAPLNQAGHAHYFTPWILAGPHRVQVEWDNARKGRCFKLCAVRLQALQGPDAANNGMLDWVEDKLKTENGVESAGAAESGSLVASLTSPVCLEGRGGFLSLLRIKSGDRDFQANHGAGDRWYANVPLAEGRPTVVDVAFQNGGLHQARTLLWKPTDLFTCGDQVVRQGDSLLFEAGAPGQGETRVEVAGNLKYAGPSKLVPCRFDTAGTQSVTATFADATGATHRKTIAVKVVATGAPTQFSASASVAPASVPANSSAAPTSVPASTGAASPLSPAARAMTANGEIANRKSQIANALAPVAWTARDRLWDSPPLAPEAVLDWDPRLQLSPATPQDAKRLRLRVDAGEDRWTLTRLGQNGPVLASSPIHGLDIYGVSESGAFYGQQYPDGSRLVETAVVQSRVLPGVRVELEIVVAGVMFEDGTLTKVLEPKDFDETGLAVVNFIMPPRVLTSNCHIMKAYQNNVLLGEY